MFQAVKFKTRMFAYVLGLLLLAVLVVAGITSYNIYNRSLELGRFLIEQEAAKAIDVLVMHHKASQSRLNAVMDCLLGRVAVEELSEGYDARHELVDGIRREYDVSATIFWLAPEGFKRISTNVLQDGQRLVGTALSDGPAYDALRSGRPYDGFSNVGGVFRIVKYQPLVRDGRVVGAVYAGKRALTPEYVDYLASIKVGVKRYAYVFDDQGRLVHHPDASLVGVDIVERFPFGKAMLGMQKGLFEYVR